MKLVLQFLFALFLSTTLFSQLPAIDVCLGIDASVCPGQQVNISQCSGGPGGTGSGIYLNSPTLLTFTDDQYSPAVNIGFNFNFYGNNYNQLVIGSNGIVTFDITQANGYCPWSCTTLPNSTTIGAQNSIALSWQDLYFPFAGGLAYQMIGTAPNRQFIISYENVSYFSSVCQTPADCFTASIVLYEGSNLIDMFISNKSFCIAWNNGLAVQGIQNSTGTIASVVTGRNNTAWAAQLDGQRFTQNSPTNYSISLVPFQTITSAFSTTTQWENTLGQTFPYISGAPLNVSNPPPGTTGYFLTATTCGAAIASISDTTFITTLSAAVTTTMTPDVCNLGAGSATAIPSAGAPPYTYSWSNGQTSSTITGLLAGTYTVTMTTADLCPATSSATITVSTILLTGLTTEVSCPSGSNGTAKAIMTPSTPGLTYLWNDPLAQTTETAAGLSAGTYTCIVTAPSGCTGNISLTVTEIPAMIVSIANQEDVLCNSGNDGIMELLVTQGTAPYTYFWQQSLSTTNSATDLIAGLNTAIVTDMNGCIAAISGTINEPPPLSISTLTPDILICPENNITLNTVGAGGSTAYTFTWTENGAIIGTGSSITVDPINSGTNYCVTITEVCGSPNAQDCMTITFFPNITASLIPDQVEKCTPAKFEFINTSSPASDIISTNFDFGDNTSTLEIFTDSTSHYYSAANPYTITTTITSTHNCIYTTSFVGLITAKPKPTADFTINSNPTTIFETTVQMQETSSNDVVAWYWSSPQSSITASSIPNPTFSFPDGIIGAYPITLAVTTALGCTDSITHELNVISDVILYAPNAFTPDGDEFNQTWKIYAQGIDETQFHLYIYNRWGEIIWETNDMTDEWDGSYKGQIVDEGVYNWVARAKDLYSDKKLPFKGSIYLLK